MVKEDIQTVIDRLADYVAACGSVSLKDAAKAVARKPPQVERFALLLEEAGLIEVHYSISGIKLVSKKKPAAPSTPDYLGKRQPANVIEEADRLEREVLTTENLRKFFDADIERRIHASEALLADLESREGFTAEELGRLRTEVDLALQQLESFGEEVRKLGEREQDFYSKLKGFRQRIDHIQARSGPAPKPTGFAGIVDALLNFIDIILMVRKPAAAAKPPATGPAQKQQAVVGGPQGTGGKPVPVLAAAGEKPKQVLATATVAAAFPASPAKEEKPAAPRKLSVPFKPAFRTGSKSSVRKRFVIKRRG